MLFDVDGTLVLTGGAGARAMTLAFRDLFGHDDAFADVPMPGRTDQLILRDAMRRAAIDVDGDFLSVFRARYLDHLEREIDHPPPGKFKGVLPGVRELLDALAAREEMFLALLTGNFKDAARVKLQHFDLWRYFPCGAFAEDAEERNALVPMAVSRARACGLPEIPAGRVVVIGDTPLDVACARAANAKAVAVATGMCGRDELEAAGPDVLFEDLSDTPAVMRALDAITAAG